MSLSYLFDCYIIICYAIGLLIIIGSVFYAGFNQKYENAGGIIQTSIIFAAGMPIVLCIIIVAFPFYLIYKLGEYFGSKKK